MSDTGAVEIILIDVADGRPFGRTEWPAGQVAETFRAEATLGLAGAQWQVVETQPADGRLLVALRRLEAVDPQRIGYTLPTIHAELPPLTPGPAADGDLVLHEDDWRQAELVDRRCAAEVEAELREIRAIWRDHSRPLGEGDDAITGFHRLHLRQGPAEPLTGPLTRVRLLDLLPPTRRLTGVAFRDGQGRVADSFAAEIGPVTLYGRCAPDGRVTVLGLTPPAAARAEEIPGLAELIREHDLLLVDWCAARVTGVADLR